MITSKDNKYIKLARSLKLKKNRIKNNMFVIEGKNMIDEAFKHDVVIHCFSTEEETDSIQLISDEVMQSITSFKTHVKYLAICKLLPNATSNHSNMTLILDDIQDPGNLGTLIRSAVAFSFDKVICSLDTVDMYNYKSLSATQGAIFNISIEYCDIVEYIEKSKNVSIAAVIDGGEIKEHNAFNLVIGNEGNGICDKVKNVCDEFVRLDISDKCESLNAAVAGSILMCKLGGKL